MNEVKKTNKIDITLLIFGLIFIFTGMVFLESGINYSLHFSFFVLIIYGFILLVWSGFLNEALDWIADTFSNMEEGISKIINKIKKFRGKKKYD